MDANSGLLQASSLLSQYYVHRMLKYRRQEEQSGALSPGRPLRKFRSRATKSFLVHQYNFFKNGVAETNSLERSPNIERSKEIDRINTPNTLSYTKYKHQKKPSLQNDVRHQIVEISRRTEVNFYRPSLQNMAVQAMRIGSPPRTANFEQEAQLRITAMRHEGGSSPSPLDHVSGIVGTVRCLKRGTALLGLEVRRLQLENERDTIDKEKKQQKIAISISKCEEPVTVLKQNPPTVFSQELIRPSKRRPPERTIVNISNEESMDTVFEEKARNYREMIFIVYLGCASYRDIEVCSTRFDRRQDVRYEYFVGRGNNANLIRSLMKKRWWWQPTNQLTAETKFVWTQRKIDSYFERQPSGEWYQPEGRSPNKLPKAIDQLVRLQNEQQLKRMLHLEDVEVYKQYIKALKKQPQSLATRMKLLKKRPVQELLQQPSMHNHFECNFHLGNKKALLRNLTSYYTFHDIPEEQWNIPLTFHCTSPQDKEFKRFAAVFRQRQRVNKKANVWIVKPGENSNRGQGIQVSRSLKEIAGMLQNKDHTFVVQQYLGDLLLYQRRKFDIRTYCLLTRVGGVLKGYWYQEGYIRTSSELYQLDNLSDQMVHLTNDAIQKFGENYGRYQPGNKLSYAEMQRYLETTFPQSNTYDMAKLTEQMKKIATEAVRSCYFRLDPHCRSYNFQVFGLDFLIDQRFRPWLLEVNTNPCLELSSPLLARLIPQMVDNALRLGLDPIYPPTACPYNCKPYLSDNSIDRNRFELIFDSQYDRQPTYQTSQHEACSYGNDDELYENEGQILNVAD